MRWEDLLEQKCLDWFSETGWDVVPVEDIDPEGRDAQRDSAREVVLRGHLRTALARFNPHLPNDALEQAITTLSTPSSLDLATSNHDFHRYLLAGVPVNYKNRHGERVTDTALVLHPERQQNRFVVVRQFEVMGTQHSGAKQLRRPDVVCFVNGLPIAVLELKTPTEEDDLITKAYNQLQTYKEEISALFVCNEALVISDGTTARVGSLTAPFERFMPWRTLKHEDDKPRLEWELETVVRGFFDPELLLDYLRYFILFEDNSGKVIKKIAGYHQPTFR